MPKEYSEEVAKIIMQRLHDEGYFPFSPKISEPAEKLIAAVLRENPLLGRLIDTEHERAQLEKRVEQYEKFFGKMFQNEPK